MNQVFKLIGYIFLGYITLCSLICVTLSLIESLILHNKGKQKRLKSRLNESMYLPVSIIVPAYNESNNILNNIKSLLNLDYSVYEIVVVDDGSRDDTASKVIKEYHMRRVQRPIKTKIPSKKAIEVYESKGEKVSITLIRKYNGGSKTDALNMGINASKYPYFVCVDADSILQENALSELVAPVFEKGNVISCTGTTRVIDCLKEESISKNPLVAFQTIEYDKEYSYSKIFYSSIKDNAGIPSPFSLFKKDIVVAVGGYNPKATGIDTELVIRMTKYCRKHKIPYNMVYVPSSVCWSNSKKSLKELTAQRIKWNVGEKKNALGHLTMLLSPKNGLLRMILLPISFLVKLCIPLLEIVGFAGLLISIIKGLIIWKYVLVLIGIYMVFNIFSSIITYGSNTHMCNLKLRKSDPFKIIYTCIIEILFFKPYLLILKLICAFKSPKALIAQEKTA